MARCAPAFSVEVIERKISRRAAVRSSAWLGVIGSSSEQLVRYFSQHLGGALAQ
jgi:hypothetical protein